MPQAFLLSSGNWLVPMRADTEGVIGDGLVEVEPQDPMALLWAEWYRQQELAPPLAEPKALVPSRKDAGAGAGAFADLDPDQREEVGLAADILLSLFGHHALEIVAHMDKGYVPCRDDRGRFAPCGGGGYTAGEREERSRKRQEWADKYIQSVKDGSITEQGKRMFVDHLLTMTAKELKDLKDHHKLEVPKDAAQLKELLVAHLADRVLNAPKAGLEVVQGLGKPMSERLAAYKEGDETVARLQKIDEERMHKAELFRIAAHNSRQAWKSRQVIFDAHAAAKGEEKKQLAKDLKKATKECQKASDNEEKAREASRVSGEAIQQKLQDELKASSTGTWDTSNAMDFPAQQEGNLKSGIEFVRAVTHISPGTQLPAVHHMDAPNNRASFTEARGGGQAAGDNAIIRLDKHDTQDVAVHEYGHYLEYHVPGIKDAAVAFLKERCGSEKPTNLAKQFPHSGYNQWEEGRQDDFGKYFGKDSSSAYYCGKEYHDGATEIISMGLQSLFNDPGGFSRKDPEYAKFIVGVLKGHIRG